jgi:8-oxo-dGTP diphosphatase
LKERRLLRVAELVRLDEQQVTETAAVLPARVTLACTELPVGTLLTLETRRVWWDLRSRGRQLRWLTAMMALFTAQEQVHVVAAALILDHRVLAAQRSHPPALAGQWEFPGGKVEKGESLRAALARECNEELGIRVEVGVELARQVLEDGARLILFQVTLSRDSPMPGRREHRELKWLDRDSVASVPWLSANEQFLPEVTSRL